MIKDIFNDIFYLGIPLPSTGRVTVQNLVVWAESHPTINDEYQDSLMGGYTLPCIFKCEDGWYDGINVSDSALTFRQIYWDIDGWKYKAIKIESGSWPINDNSEFIGMISFYDSPEQNAVLQWLFDNGVPIDISLSEPGEVEDGYICSLKFKNNIDASLFGNITSPQIYSQGFQVGDSTYYGIQFTENEMQYKLTNNIENDDWIPVYYKSSQSWEPSDSPNGSYQFIKFKMTDDLNLEIPKWLYDSTLLTSPLQITNINMDVNDNGESILRIDIINGFTILLSNFDANNPLSWNGELPIGWGPKVEECPSLNFDVVQYIEPQMPVFCPKNQLTINPGKMYTLDASPLPPENECSVMGSIKYHGKTYIKMLITPRELTLYGLDNQTVRLYNAPNTGEYRVTLSSKISETLKGESPILNIEHKLKTESDSSYQTITKITANGAFQQIQESPSAIYLTKAESSQYQSQITTSGKTEYGNATKLKLLAPQKENKFKILSLTGPFYEDTQYISPTSIKELFSLDSNGIVHARDVILHLPNGRTKKLSTLASNTDSGGAPDLDITTEYVFNCGSATELIN